MSYFYDNEKWIYDDSKMKKRDEVKNYVFIGFLFCNIEGREE